MYYYTQDNTPNNNPATLNYRSVEDRYVPLKIKLLIESTEAFLENKFSDVAKHNQLGIMNIANIEIVGICVSEYYIWNTNTNTSQ